jgi:hypothetical protein
MQRKYRQIAPGLKCLMEKAIKIYERINISFLGNYRTFGYKTRPFGQLLSFERDCIH